MFSDSKRRRGRPAHMRSPDDSPLRDGNRDRLMGLLTDRAARTLAYYLVETNLNVHHWLQRFIKEHPIPRDGHWDDVSGDTFLRTLMSMPMDEAKYDLGRDPVFDNTSTCAVDPRSIAQRIMEIRCQLALEFVQDLKTVAEDNKLLQLEMLQASLLSTEDAIADGSAAARDASTASATASGSGGTPGGGAAARARAEEEAARARPRKKKASVLPPQPTPSNWRLRLEVEAQVHGTDSVVSSSGSVVPSADGSGTGIPDSVMTGRISPIRSPPGSPPSGKADAGGDDAEHPPSSAAPQATSSTAASSPGAGKDGDGSPSPRPHAPLHPEVAELLPLIRASPSALTPDVAAVLSSLATSPDGRLHPDIADALRDAVAAGAKLHPEMAELLHVNTQAKTQGEAGKAGSSGSKAGGGVGPAAGAGGLAVPVVLGGAGSGTGAAGAPKAEAQAAGSVVEQQEKEEEPNVIRLEDDIPFNSDDD